MRYTTQTCTVTIGEPGSFYPEIPLNTPEYEYLSNLFKDNTFLKQMASYFEDGKFIDDVKIEALSISENNCNLKINFNSEYSNRVVNKVMYDNFYHYLRSGGIHQYTNGGELFIRFNNAEFSNTDNNLIDQIDHQRKCQICGQNAYIYYYDKDNDLSSSECIDYDPDTFVLSCSSNISRYKITDTNHNLLVEVTI